MMHRALSRRRLNVDRVAEVAGRFAGSLMRTVPGVCGALLICGGIWMVYRPAAWVTAGLFLLVLDRRVP